MIKSYKWGFKKLVFHGFEHCIKMQVEKFSINAVWISILFIHQKVPGEAKVSSLCFVIYNYGKSISCKDKTKQKYMSGTQIPSQGNMDGKKRC